MEQLVSNWKDFRQIQYLILFQKIGLESPSSIKTGAE
jgi:hypothetical protein